ncbi:P-selectin-like isoform X1 [Chiloscyllium plagiosum]|uniref:P-selectin-like isoform X1 n=2 Tax=Chiloscyllium plagiosum TaxID=36176 RepID=UPI001CB7DDCB|nr:P-selectin-like isoform X1 [Chiloscyllium plagiosum]
MVSHDYMICISTRWPNLKGNVFRLLALVVLICEILMLEGVNGWIYHYSNRTMKWNAARKYCRERYTDMVAIQNMEENQYLNEYLPKGQTHVWIGLRKVNNIWTWIGTNRTLETFAMNWAPNEPNNGKNNEDCVEMYIKRTLYAGKWNDEPCLRRKRPLCYQASCKLDSCSGHGECVETIGYFKCKCNEGFYGVNCEKVIKCIDLEAPDRSFMSCFHSYGNFSYDSICNFSCVEGYEISTTQRLQCTASAVWSAPVPECKVKKCRWLEVPRKDTLNCSHPLADFSYNSTCTFSCREGYVLNGLDTLQCLASGQWSGRIPNCKVQVCETLTAPDYGNMSCIHPIADFHYNSTCNFSCSKGFALSGQSRIQCRISGEWTPQKPTCEAVKCSELKTPQNLLVNCSDPFRPFSYSSKCDFGCATGLILQGSDSLQCEASGQWTAEIPTCKAVPCSLLTIPKQGTMNCKSPFEDFSYGSTCVFGCTEGFVLQGSSNLWCQASGLWTAQVPSCEAVNCTSLKDPERGTMNCSHPFGLFSYNATCDFNCEEGFIINGSGSVQCGATGQWTTETPSCEVSKCKLLTQPEYGVMNCSHPIGEFSYISTCQFWCSEGFLLSGTNWLECDASGQWTAKTPTCKAMKCNVLKSPDRGTYNCSHPIGDFSYRSSCDFSCAEGFTLIGSERVECGASGQWTAQIPMCKVVTCQTLTQPEQGTMNCYHPFGNFSYNSVCDFNCTEGYVLQWSDKLQCQANGLWTKEIPTCKAINCQTLSPPEQGTINCSHPIEEFSYKSTCDFNCDEGFVLNGRDKLQCQASGQWTADTPLCKAVTCQTLTLPERGTMRCSHPIRDFSYNSTCDFNCDEGFILNSSGRLQCQASGQWTAHTPTCKAVTCQTLTLPERGTMRCSHPIGNFSYDSTCDFNCDEGFILNGSGRLQCQASGQWTAHSPTCKAVTCQTLTQPEQGALNCSHRIGNFSYNSICDFSCNKGFVLHGSKRIQCQANKEWTAQIPNCKAVRCNIPKSLKHGSMSCSHPNGAFSYNSVCDLGCAKGFYLKGRNQLECTALGQWTNEMPNCEVVKCQELNVDHPTIMNCSYHLGNFSYGSICDFDCAEDFKLEGSVRLQCNESGQWTDEAPHCNVLLGLPPSSNALTYVSTVAAVAVLAGILAMIVTLIRRKLKTKAYDTTKLNSDSTEGLEGMFENPVFDNSPEGSIE